MDERNKCNFKNNEKDMDASEPAEQYIIETDPDIFNNVDFKTGTLLFNTIAHPQYHLNLKMQLLS